jgi:hypothetical protein
MRALGADHDMGIDNVGGSGFREQETRSCGIGTIQRNKVGPGLTNQSRKPDLPHRAAQRLRKCSRWDGSAQPELRGSIQER